ncbi:hypothetical protein ACFOPX_04975, partial [Helicobacter baculiformis]
MATLDFAKLRADGVSQRQVLDFVRQHENNFNYDALDAFYKQKGLDDQERTQALMADLEGFKEFSFTPQPPQVKPTPPPQPPLKASFEQASQSEPMDMPPAQAHTEAAQSAASKSKQEELGYHALVHKALKDKVPYEKLPKEVRRYLTDAGFKELSLVDSILHPLEFFSWDHGKRAYTQEGIRASILQVKDVKDLTPEQKRQIYRDRSLGTSVWNSLFTDAQEDLKEYQEQIKGRYLTADVQKAMSLYNNVAQDMLEMVFSDDPKVRARYQEGAQALVKGLGFDEARFDPKGAMYVLKDGQAFKVNEGFFDNFKTIIAGNAFSLVGSLIGSSVGGALKGSRGGVGGMVVGGALGAFAGGGVDAMLTNFILDRAQNFKETLKHMRQEGVLSVVGDVAFLGGREALKRAPGALGNLIHYIPITGRIQRALDGNAKAAQSLIAQVYTPEQEEALKAFAKQFGGGVNLSNPPSALRQSFTKHFGEDSPMLKGFDRVHEILALPSSNERQEAFIRAIRADESGNLSAFLSEVAHSSMRAHGTLKSILNKTTAHLAQELNALKLKGGDVKAIFEDLDKGTQQSYQDAMDRVLAQALNSEARVKLNSAPLEHFKAELAESGLSSEAKPFIKALEGRIYSPQGVNFTQLNNALKMLNSYHKHTQDPHLRDHIQRAFEGFVRQDIKEGINRLLEKTPPALMDKYKELYHTALSDYATMKQVMKDVKKLGLRDALKSEQEGLEALLSYAKGQGDRLDNLSKITQ